MAQIWIGADTEQHRKAWEGRGDGDAERKVARNRFGWTDLLKMLQGANQDLAVRISDEYDQLIDHGAHPNVDGLALSSDSRQLDQDKFEIVTIFAHGREAVLVGMLDLLRCMHYVWQLLFMVIKERLQILALDAEFQKSATLIHELISKLEAEQKQGAG